MQTVRAAVSDTRGGFTIEFIEVDAPGPGEVQVRIGAAGVCHTDYDSMRWDQRIVMGHEGAGTVTAIGASVSRCAVGDRVLLNWAVPCGECFQCARGNEAICETQNPVTAGNTSFNAGHARPEATQLDGAPIQRSFNLGTMAELTVVREAAVVKAHVPIPFASAAVVGCGVMTGYGSARNAAAVEAGSSCVVIGAGGVGLNVIQGCRLAGAASILAIDINAHRLELARQFGATDTLRADPEDAGLRLAAAGIRARLGGRGADYAFESTAVPALGAAPLAMVRNGGTAVQVSGIEAELTIDMSLFEWDKIYLNPLYGQCQPQRDIPRILEHYASGELLLDELVTRTYELLDLEQAFADMLAGRNAKGVLLLTGPADA